MPLPLYWADIKLDFENKFFYFDFKYNNQPLLPPLEASKKTIQQIVEKFPSPYVLFLSGGIDSQAMLYAWAQSGVNFTTYSAVYNNNLNNHDLIAMKEFSRIHNIKVNYVNFDLINFLEKEHDYFARSFYCGSPQITSFMKMVENLTEGTAILSGNFLLLDELEFNPKYKNYPNKNSLSLYLYAKMSNKNVVPFFFLESPELAYSFTVNDYVRQINKYLLSIQDIDGTDYMHKMKLAYYQSHGFPVLHQYKKLTGFEIIKDFYDANFVVPKNINKLDRLPSQKSQRVFDILYRNRYENRLSDYKFFIR